MAKVITVEIKQDKNGRDYKSARLDSPVMGKDRFNVFGRHTRYEDVVTGRDFASEEFVKEGDFLNLIDYNKGVKQGLGGSRSFTEAQNTKRQDIERAQENKQDAVKTASTARDASAITVALMAKGDVEDWRVTWEETRNWLISHWEPEAF